MKWILWTIFIMLLAWETYSLLPLRAKGPATHPGYVVGAIHVHSDASDGGGTMSQIAKAAEDSGMDFVVVTDHDTSRARSNGKEKRYGNVDMFVEIETSTPAGHALVFYSHTPMKELSDAEVGKVAWQHFLGQETKPGLFLIVSHPSHVSKPWARLDRYPEGIEVFNFDAMWQRQMSESYSDFGLTLTLYPFNQYLAGLRLFQIYPKDFTAWDTMNAVTRGHFGILGHESHSNFKFTDNLRLPWPTYEETFRAAANVFYIDGELASDFEARKKQIYRSIQKGAGAIVFHSIFPYEGNDSRMECEGKTFRSSQDPIDGKGCDLVVQTPEAFPYPRVIKVWKDGELFKEVEANGLRIALPGPGLYRTEVWAKARTLTRLLLHRDVPYVFYNPVYVR